MGDRRFTDLRAALPGIAPNLLTERLRSLQSIGLITAVELPPPAARSVYSLTDEGKRVEPVLRSVARFGAAYLSGEPSETMDAERVAYALLAPWRRRPEQKIRARLTVPTTRDERDDTVDLVARPRRHAGRGAKRQARRRVARRGPRPRHHPPDGRGPGRSTHRRPCVAPHLPRSVRSANGQISSLDQAMRDEPPGAAHLSSWAGCRRGSVRTAERRLIHGTLPLPR